jgi:hypothetical protein
MTRYLQSLTILHHEPDKGILWRIISVKVPGITDQYLAANTTTVSRLKNTSRHHDFLAWPQTVSSLKIALITCTSSTKQLVSLLNIWPTPDLTRDTYPSQSASGPSLDLGIKIFS